MFGGGGFSQNTGSAFGSQPQSQAPVFGQNLNSNTGNLNLTASPGLFGTPQRPPQQGFFGAGQASSTPVQQQNAFGANTQQNTGSLFGGQQTQQQQPPLFGTPTAPVSTQAPGSLNLFGSNQQSQFGSTQQSNVQQPNLFGSNQQNASSLFGNAGQQTQSVPAFGQQSQPQQSQSLFGSNVAATQSQAPNLFGSTTQQAPSSLFGTTGQQPQATLPFGQAVSSAQSSQPNLFGSNLVTGQAPTSISTNLLGNQQKPASLFGTNTGLGQQQTPLLGSLPISSTATSQPNLFGSTLPSTQSNLSTSGMFNQQPNVTSVFGKQTTKKNSPLEDEVPPVFKDLLQELRKKISENSEEVLKFESNTAKEPDSFRDRMENATQFIKTIKSNADTLLADAKNSVSAVTNEVCNCKALIEIHKQQKLHPSQASDQLCHLLLKIGNNLHSKIGKINDKVYELEYPLREYISWKENGMESQTVSRQELLDHVNQFVSICNLTFMNSTELDNKIEQLKVLYSTYLQKAYGRSKSPFDSLKDKGPPRTELFEYDPTRGIKGSGGSSFLSIWEMALSTLAAGNMQKSINAQQQQPSLGFGSFQPQQQTSNSIFGGGQRPAPFSLGTSSQPTNQLGLSTGNLFNRPIAAPTSIATTAPTLSLTGQPTTSKPAFQLPALNTTMPTFGSTLNSSSSGTLFGGSASKSPLFGAK